MDKDQIRQLKADIKSMSEKVFDPARIKAIKKLLPDIEDSTLQGLLLDTYEGKRLAVLNQLLEAA